MVLWFMIISDKLARGMLRDMGLETLSGYNCLELKCINKKWANIFDSVDNIENIVFSFQKRDLKLFDVFSFNKILTVS